MTSFHTILPSNSSIKTYPDNTLNHYVTALWNRIELDGDWDVALSEILFQRTWYNIQENICMLSIITSGNEIDLFLPEGFYSDGHQLVDRCNRMIERNLKDTGTIVDTKFPYDATSRKISVHVGADNVVTLSSDLASIMGFSPRQLTFREERKYKGKVAMDSNRGFNSHTSIAMRLKLYQWATLKLPFYACSRKFWRFKSSIVYDALVRKS